MKFLFVTLLILFCYALSFILTAGAIWVVCICFSWAFSWKIALGIWVILSILSSIFHVTIDNQKN